MTQGDADKRGASPKRPRAKVDGIYWSEGTERQTVTANQDKVGSQPWQQMEEVLRKENLHDVVTQKPSRDAARADSGDLNRRVRNRTHGGVGGRRG